MKQGKPDQRPEFKLTLVAAHRRPGKRNFEQLQNTYTKETQWGVVSRVLHTKESNRLRSLPSSNSTRQTNNSFRYSLDWFAAEMSASWVLVLGLQPPRAYVQLTFESNRYMATITNNGPTRIYPTASFSIHEDVSTSNAPARHWSASRYSNSTSC
jgi:hypothetical protein